MARAAGWHKTAMHGEDGRRWTVWTGNSCGVAAQVMEDGRRAVALIMDERTGRAHKLDKRVDLRGDTL